MADRSIAVRVTAVVSDFQRSMASASASVKGFSGDVARLGRDYRQEMTTIGTATAAAGLAIAGALGASANAAISWESAFAGVVKTVDATDAELAGLEQGLRDLAQEIPVTHEELAGIAEAAGQLGIETGNILGFTETMAALGVATNLTSTEAATMFARFANITGLPQDKIENLGSAVVDLGNNLATTEREIAEMGLRIAGAGAQIGLSEADILGFAGALSSVGIEAQAGGTAISRVFVEIDKAVRGGGDTLASFAQTAGMSADEFSQAYERDASGAIVTFIEGLGKISAEGGDVFGVLEDLELQDIRVRDALLRAAGAGDDFRNAIERGNTAFEENTALGREAELRYETVESEIIKAKNALMELGITVGEVILPVLVPMIEGIRDLAKWFSDLPAPVRTAGVVLAGVSATLLTIGGTALILIPRIITLIDAFKKLAAARAIAQAGGIGKMLPTPTVGGGGLIGGAAAGTAATVGAVGVAAVATGVAVKEGIDLANAVDRQHQSLSEMAADLMRAAERGDQEAAARLGAVREEFVDNAGWLEKNVLFWTEAFVANRALLEAEEQLETMPAQVSEFSEAFRSGAGYAGTWAEGIGGAASATDGYRGSLEDAAEAQRILVQGMNVAFGEVGSAIQAIQQLQAAEENKQKVEADGTATAEEIAQAQFDYAASLYAAQEAVDNVSPDAVAAAVQGLADALGTSTEEAYELLNSLNLLDGKQIETFVRVRQQFTTEGARTAAGNTLGRPLEQRAAGGPVSARDMYRMGEGNRPELLATGSGLFVVPGDQGRVFSNAQSERLMSALSGIGSGGGVTVNITQNWPQGQRVEDGTRRALSNASFLRAAS